MAWGCGNWSQQHQAEWMTSMGASCAGPGRINAAHPLLFHPLPPCRPFRVPRSPRINQDQQLWDDDGLNHTKSQLLINFKSAVLHCELKGSHVENALENYNSSIFLFVSNQQSIAVRYVGSCGKHV